VTTAIQFLPANLQNALVFAGTVGLVSLVLFVVCSLERSSNLKATLYSALLSLPILMLGVLSSVGVALAVAGVMLAAVLLLMLGARQHRPAQWDWSMLRLPAGEQRRGTWGGAVVAGARFDFRSHLLPVLVITNFNWRRLCNENG